MRTSVSPAAQIAAGATLGGCGVGAIEALYRAVPGLFGVTLYGALWALLGLAAALPASRLARRLGSHPPLLGWSASAAAGASLFVLGRFVAFRDIFEEAPQKAAAALGVGAAVGGATILTGLALTYGLRRLPLHPGPWLWAVPVLPLAAMTWRSVGPTDAEPVAAPEHLAHVGQAPLVIVVVADALRADALGAYGAGPHRGAPATPALDTFAATSRVFVQARAQASWTKPAMASLLTSRLVSGHGTMSKTATLPATLPTLASVLQEQGVATAAVVTNYNLTADFGYARGFDHFTYLAPARYLNAPASANRLAAYNVYRLLRERYFKAGRESRYFYRSATAVNEAAWQHLDALGDSRGFLWLHYMEAHDPYFDTAGASWARVSDPNPPIAAAAAMQRAYRDGVARFDTAFAALLAGLQRRNRLATTLLIVTADHGEEFADHGGFYHGTSLYEEMLHIPLIIHGPHIAPGVHHELVRQIDIAPTVLSFLQTAAPVTWEGTDLLPEPAAGARDAVAEENHEGHILSAIYRPAPAAHAAAPPHFLKLIVANATNPRGLPDTELYDLAADPLEKRALSPDDPQADVLKAQLAARRDASRRGAGTPHVDHPYTDDPPQRPLDPAAEAELRSLGYVQ